MSLLRDFWRRSKQRPSRDSGVARACLVAPRTTDAPILRDRDTSDGSGGDPNGDCTDSDDEHLYYTQDANFNVTALVERQGTEGTSGNSGDASLNSGDASLNSPLRLVLRPWPRLLPLKRAAALRFRLSHGSMLFSAGA